MHAGANQALMELPSRASPPGRARVMGEASVVSAHEEEYPVPAASGFPRNDATTSTRSEPETRSMCAPAASSAHIDATVPP